MSERQRERDPRQASQRGGGRPGTGGSSVTPVSGAGGHGDGPAGAAKSGARPGGGFPRVAAAVAAALVVAAGLGYALLGGTSDSVDPQDAQARQAAYSSLVAAGGLPLRMVAADEVDGAVGSIPVPPDQREKIRQDVARGQVRLAWVTITDTHAEDGDIVRLEALGSVPVDVTATNTPTTLAIPFPADGVVKVTGIHDGGGGITIAVESGQARIDWPAMQPGQSLDLPVSPSN